PRLLASGLAPHRPIHAALKASGINPASGCGRAVVLERCVSIHQLSIRDGIAVYLFEDCLGARLLGWAAYRVVPHEIENRAVLPIARLTIERFQPPAQMIDEVQLAARVAGRFDGLMMPLEQALRIC